MTKFAEKISGWISGFLLVLACIALLILAGHVTASITGRYLLGKPIAATLEIGTFYYMVAVTFLPLAFAQRERGHVSVDFVVELLPQRANRLLAILADMLTLAFLLIFSWATTISAIEKTRRNDYVLTQHFDLTLWPSRWLLVAGLIAFSIVVAVQIIVGLRDLVVAPRFKEGERT
ncbi:TRAP transporter small permease [Oceanicola sp. 502str15]|uniref:TRAP transporter small permease n=1 Tax=Oceanicola sp. 502str15 TaxID=2696061 RepID=UPI00209627BB|nr:TRAP transporter small permease subunit [Oceanicola sp. 502str15]MCO6385296.1 TRAP transporter small permease subunit [Oceanicola sp. 502str15]